MSSSKKDEVVKELTEQGKIEKVELQGEAEEKLAKRLEEID